MSEIMNFKLLAIFFIISFFVLSFAHASIAVNTCTTNICFSGACRTTTLTPRQVQDLWDGFLYKFLKPSTMASGKDAKTKLAKATNPKSLKKSGGATSQANTQDCDIKAEINVVNKNSPLGAAVKVGCKSQGPDKKDFEQYESCMGDFAYGLVLNDTLRVGRCFGAASPEVDQKKCSVYDYALGYRNAIDAWSLAKQSLKGLLPGIKEGWGSSALSSNFTKKVTKAPVTNNNGFLQKNNNDNTTQDYTGPPPDIDLLNKNIGSKNVHTRKHAENPKDVIHNDVLTDDFSVYFQDMCSGQDAQDRCKLYIYSVFDRFYNSYYSGSMIIAAAAPTVYGIGEKAVKSVPGVKSFAEGFSGLASKAKSAATFGGFENAAKNAAKNAAEAARKIGLPAEELKNLDAALSKKSLDDASPIIDKIVKGLKDDPLADEKTRALADYLSTKVTYGKVFANVISNSTEDEAIKTILKQGDAQSAMGQSLLDTFFKKKGAKYADYYVKPDSKVLDLVELSDKAVRKKVLNGEITELYKAGTPTSAGVVLDVKKMEDLATQGGYYINTPAGTKLYLTGSNLDVAKKLLDEAPHTGLPVFKAGNATLLSDKDSKDILAELKADFIKNGKTIATDVSNRSADLMQSLEKQGVLNQRYFNLLQWMLFNKNTTWKLNPIKKFGLSVVLPQIYWVSKTSDSSPLKAYFVGKRDLSNSTISIGKTPTYNDAYVDFFSNKSFSSGDFFGDIIIGNGARLLAKLAPGTVLPDQILTFSGVKQRDDVKNIVLYTGTKNCPDCSSGSSTSNGTINVTAIAKNDTQNYILELPDRQTALDGLSLALFTHHTNIDFNLNATQGNNITDHINIDQAIANKNTCLDKIISSPIFNSFDWFKDAPARAGIVLGIADNVIFYLTTGFLPGISGYIFGGVGTYLIDAKMMEHFQGCVDSEEGYYIHYIHQMSNNKLDKQQTGVRSLLSNVTGSQSANTTSSTKTPAALNKVNSAMNKIKTKLLSLVQNHGKEFMQIDYKTYVKSSAHYQTDNLFLSWLGKRAMCYQTKEDNQSVIAAVGKDEKGKSHTLVIDKSKNTVSLDNKTILKSDLVGLAQRNGAFGGFEIPQSVTFMPADLEVDYFEFHPNGNFKILDPSTSLCALHGAATQSGLNYSNILQYTGLATKIFTTNSGVLIPNGSYFTSLGGISQRANINGNLVVDKNIDVVNVVDKLNLGQLTSVKFQKALLLYQATQKQFALWIRIVAQINGKDVQSFKGKPTTVINPKTGCEEQAIDLSVLGNQNDTGAQTQGQEFNQALKKAGPFQYFETPDNTIMFYSKKDKGECKEYMKVIDKKTGKVLTDSEISSVSTDPDGAIKITTADGKTHTLGFSNENGQPTLTFDGKKSPLLMAQGRNGSFYFNPDSGQWTVGNSQMLPFDDKFASLGWKNTGGVTKPGGNPIIPETNTYGTKGSWDIPLFDGNERYLFIFMSLFVVVFLLYFSKNSYNNFLKKKK